MNPIQRFGAFPGRLQHFVRRALVNPIQLEPPAPDTRIRLDVTRCDDAYAVNAEMPGVKMEDIHVTIDGTLVTITGRVTQERSGSDEAQVIRSERRFGRIERRLALAHEIDEASVSATYADGVLRLHLPLRDKDSSDTRTVQ